MLLASLPVVMGFSWLERLFAPDAQLLDERWQVSDDANEGVISHAAWDSFLKTHIRRDANGINRLPYDAVTPQARAQVKSYVQQMQAVMVSTFSSGEQLSYWINLYNAVTVDVVLDHYPIDSIRDINFGNRFANGPWSEKLVKVEGVDLSLNDIEHGIIRPVFNEPRIHYAVNCAAAGCPNLQAQAFTAANLETMLTTAAREFVNNPRGVTITRDGKLIASSIYNWFAADFGGTEAAVIDHLRKHSNASLAIALADRTSIDDYAYDWTLNDYRGV